jgi:hypothetical protein
VAKLEVWRSIGVFVCGHLDVKVVPLHDRLVVQPSRLKLIEEYLEVIERYLFRKRWSSIRRSVCSHFDRLLQSDHVGVVRLDLRSQSVRPLGEVSLVVAIVDGRYLT